MKKENENPSIGIILCKEANRIVVEYALSRTMSPVMVAQYKKQLIPKEVLQRTFEEYLALPETIPETAGDVVASKNRAGSVPAESQVRQAKLGRTNSGKSQGLSPRIFLST